MTIDSNFIIINQMIKETSLEVKNSLQTFQKMLIAENRAKIHVKIALNKPQINVINKGTKQQASIDELELQYTIHGFIGQEVIFIVEVIHSSIIKSENADHSKKEQFYSNDYPFTMVPYIYCNAVQLLQSAGFAGLIIPPVEFIDSQDIVVVGHYAKDTSFQIHCLPETFMNIKNDENELKDINIDFNVKTKQKHIDNSPFIGLVDSQHQMVEIEIYNSIQVKKQNNLICTSEVIYAIVVRINKQSSQEVQNILLTVECPRLYFPFLIAITNKALMDAGLNKIYIPPINFSKLLSIKLQANQSTKTINNSSEV